MTLKRIQEKHSPVRDSDVCRSCGAYWPCDTVRLAWALTATLHSLRTLHDTLDASKSPWVQKVLANSKARTVFVGAERLLEELGGD